MPSQNDRQQLRLVEQPRTKEQKNPEAARLTREIIAIRDSLREIIKTAEQEDRRIEPYELYELAYIPLTMASTPRANQMCSSCGHVNLRLLEMGFFLPNKPTAVCLCPPKIITIPCDALIVEGTDIVQCDSKATRSHVNGRNIVCKKHRKAKQLTQLAKEDRMEQLLI